MLELLRMDLVYFLALVSLLIMLFAPLTGVWIALSIRRDIHRIADALEVAATKLPKSDEGSGPYGTLEDMAPRPRVANSAFGR